MPPLPDPDAAVALAVDRLASFLLQRLDRSGTHGRDNIIGLEVQRHWPGFALQSDGGQTGTKEPAKPAEAPASPPPKVPRRRAEMERLVEAETREPPKTQDGA